MPDIHIHRDHALGLEAARLAAQGWADKARAKFDLDCRYDAGATEDTLHFSRSGVNGTLQVTAEAFVLQAQLGFLFGAFQPQIEAEIGRQLDRLLNPAPADPSGA